MIFNGKAIKYGDNVDTDVIIPARYLNAPDHAALASHCMEDIDPEFVEKANPGDIIVAQDNFGCGSSREHAPISIKVSGVSCVIAESFARIFYRNAINIGLPIITSPEAAAEINRQISEKGEINMIFAAAPSQNDVLKALVEDKSIEWDRVNAYHMDEYIGLDKDAPQGFGNFLKAHIFGLVPFKSVNYIDITATDPEAEAVIRAEAKAAQRL